MIKLKENQLIAMLEIAKNNPGVDIWDLMNVAGVEIVHENEPYLEVREINVGDLMGQDIQNLMSVVDTEKDTTNNVHFESEEISIRDLINYFKSFDK